MAVEGGYANWKLSSYASISTRAVGYDGPDVSENLDGDGEKESFRMLGTTSEKHDWWAPVPNEWIVFADKISLLFQLIEK